MLYPQRANPETSVSCLDADGLACLRASGSRTRPLLCSDNQDASPSPLKRVSVVASEDPIAALVSEFVALWFPDTTDPRRIERRDAWSKLFREGKGSA